MRSESCSVLVMIWEMFTLTTMISSLTSKIDKEHHMSKFRLIPRSDTCNMNQKLSVIVLLYIIKGVPRDFWKNFRFWIMWKHYFHYIVNRFNLKGLVFLLFEIIMICEVDHFGYLIVIIQTERFPSGNVCIKCPDNSCLWSFPVIMC